MKTAEFIAARLSAMPYARTLGVEPVVKDGAFRLSLPFRDTNIGNPMGPALHGGAVGGFMELCAIIQLMLEMERDGTPKPIGVSADYLRPGRPADTLAEAKVKRLGSRVANVRVVAWQGDREKPIATLHGNFLLPGK